MSLASEMAMISKVSTNDYVKKTYEKGLEIIRKAANEGKNYVCFYDICHSCNKGWTKDNENAVIKRLKEDGFDVVQKWRIFGGDQVTPYVVW